MTNFNFFTTSLKSTLSKQITTLLLVFILIFGFCTEGSSQCPCTDCRCTDSLELVKLYNATNGANWTRKWVLTQPMTSWYGVTLENDKIVAVYLGNNKLNGTLPNLNLMSLREFDLSTNQLNGSIPNFNLPELLDFRLYSNQFSGQIPNFNLPKLQELRLYLNQLNGIMPNFNLPKLKNLDLYGNQLSGSIPNFNLPSLETLNLPVNQLSGVIPNFNLPNLQVLILGVNQLSGQIPSFSNLRNLKFLALATNQLNGQIPNFNLPLLSAIILYSNQLSGQIPNFNSPNLSNISLYANQLSGPIPVFNLPSLLIIRFDSNQLSGCIPRELKIKCPLITSERGNVSNNPNLATQSWKNYWNNGEGACLTNAVADTQENNGRLYPNPAHDFLFLEGSEKASKILIYNVLGSLVLNKNANDKGIDISHLSNGIYTVRIVSGEKSATRLFMKN